MVMRRRALVNRSPAQQVPCSILMRLNIRVLSLRAQILLDSAMHAKVQNFTKGLFTKFQLRHGHLNNFDAMPSTSVA